MRHFFTLIATLAQIVFISSGHSLRAQTPSDALEQSLPGVVTVAVYQTDGLINRKPLGVRDGKINIDVAYAKALNLSGATSSGSGFVVAVNGQKYVLTNAHVVESVADATGSLAVFSINQTKYNMRVVGGDALYDFAVLGFIDPPGPELVPLTLRSAPARIGERVYAIGNPIGQYPYTVTDGIISAKNRVRDGLTGKFGFLQTSATVIWGNSGGPLVDERGQVLGINSQIAFAPRSDTTDIWLSQINFALETPIVQRLLSDVLTNDGLIVRAYFGLEFSETVKLIVDPNGRKRVLYTAPTLSDILPDSPVKSIVGSFLGQRITAINGEEVRSVEEILGALETIRPGNTADFTFNDGNRSSTISLKASTLTPIQLESIARFVLKRNGLGLVDTPRGIVVNAAENTGNIEMDKQRKAAREPADNGIRWVINGRDTKQAPPVPLVGNYPIVAAGQYVDKDLRNSKLWRVDKLSYFGAVCRLMGLSSFVDIIVAATTYSGEIKIGILHQMLSGQKNTKKYCLWY